MQEVLKNGEDIPSLPIPVPLSPTNAFKQPRKMFFKADDCCQCNSTLIPLGNIGGYPQGLGDSSLDGRRGCFQNCLFPAPKSQILKLNFELQRNAQLNDDYRWTEKRPLGLLGKDLTERSLASQDGDKGKSQEEKRETGNRFLKNQLLKDQRRPQGPTLHSATYEDLEGWGRCGLRRSFGKPNNSKENLFVFNQHLGKSLTRRKQGKTCVNLSRDGWHCQRHKSVIFRFKFRRDQTLLEIQSVPSGHQSLLTSLYMLFCL